MDNLKLIFFPVLLILSISKVNAAIYKYSISYYEFIPLGDTVVFTPTKNDPIPNKGTGYVKNNPLYSTRQRDRVLGHVGGMYFYHGVDVIEDVVTITFGEDLKGMWSGSSINLRGLWYMTADGEADLDDQELAIVGGQGHFRGATGSVFYKRVQSQPQSIFFVTCHIYLPDFLFNGEVIEVDLNEQFKTNAKPEYFQGHGELIKESTSTT